MECMKKALLCLLLLGASLSLPAQAPKPPSAKDALEGKFLHHVYFWLNEPDNPKAREEFLTALKKMKAIPTIRQSYIGTPAGTPRDVVDNTWTFYWLLTFDNREGWQVYNDHPIHDEFRKKANLWKKIQVYDTLPEK